MNFYIFRKMVPEVKQVVKCTPSNEVLYVEGTSIVCMLHDYRDEFQATMKSSKMRVLPLHFCTFSVRDKTRRRLIVGRDTVVTYLRTELDVEIVDIEDAHLDGS